MLGPDGKALDFVRLRQREYHLAFGSPAGAAVLADLAKFCRANTTCYHDDPRLHAVLEGRREVWLRIQNHLNLTTTDLYALLGGVTVKLTEPEGDET